jgi:hypothetical protein
MPDATEPIRRKMLQDKQPAKDLANEQGPTWTTAEMQRDFEPIGFLAPFVVVRRRSDGVKGTLEFTHSPRVYFAFVPENS